MKSLFSIFLILSLIACGGDAKKTQVAQNDMGADMTAGIMQDMTAGMTAGDMIADMGVAGMMMQDMMGAGMADDMMPPASDMSIIPDMASSTDMASISDMATATDM